MAGGSPVAVVAALVGNLTIAILKLVAGLVANSAAMLAEAAHSFSDTGNQVLLMLGIWRSKAPPSPERPYGGGKSAYFWPFLVAVLLFGVAGAYSVFEGIEKVRHPHEIGDIRLSLAVLAAAFVIEAIVLAIAVRQAVRGARKQGVRGVRQFLDENRDASLLTVIVEDSLALVGLPIAAGALVASKVTGNPVWDGVGSLLIGLLLMGFALFLAAEVKDLLLGRGLGRGDLAKVHAILAGDADLIEVFDVRSVYFGPETVLLAADVHVRDGLESNDVERVLARVERALVDAVPQLRFVYLEPRGSPSVPPRRHGAHEPRDGA